MTKRWKYTDEYRRDVAAMVIDGNQSARVVSRDLDIPLSTVQAWATKERRRRRGDGDQDAGADHRDLARENARLRREIATLREEVEFLGKASAFFAARQARTSSR